MKALSLGYTKTLKELYDTAGIRFDFSPAYIKELGSFVKDRLEEMGVKEVVYNITMKKEGQQTA
jgi:oligoendopeptidase F